MQKTSEWVSLGHPDKICDYISSYLLDEYLRGDAGTRYAVEVQMKDEYVTLGGEVTSLVKFSPEKIEQIVKEAVADIGYTKEYRESGWGDEVVSADMLKVVSHISEQSPDIAMGVNGDGWGDQGIFWGMAVNMRNHGYMPADWFFAKTLGTDLFRAALANDLSGLDIKTQVTMEKDRVIDVVVAMPLMDSKRKKDIEQICYQVMPNRDFDLHINGSGRYVRHGSKGDCGTTGRKLAVDLYGGNCRIGGGCVDGETEYLSPAGWKKIKDYDGGKVGQINNDLQLSFVVPERYIQTESDDVYDISMQNTLSMVLSGNHNVFYRTSKGNFCKKSLNELLKDSNNNMRGSHAEIPRYFSYDFADGTAKYTDAEARLIVAHCADGTVMGKTRCRISVKRTRKIERLRQILEQTGKKFEEKKYADGFTRFYYDLDNPSKLLSEHFANPDKHTAQLLAEEVFLWDGSVKFQEYNTTCKKDADFVQFVMAGITGDSWSLITKDKHKSNNATVYTVRKIRHKYSSPFRKMPNDKVQKIHKLAPQKVFCFTVPTGLLLLRRKNYIFVTGNSPWTKDGTKADLTLNLAAREYALHYMLRNDLPEVHCSISCRIGAKDVFMTFYDEHMNELQSSKVTLSPYELIHRYSLTYPMFAILCREGLFSWTHL